MGTGLSETLSGANKRHVCDVQLVIVIEEGGLGGILSCLLTPFLLLSTQSNRFLKVPFLSSEAPTFGCGGLLTLLDCLAEVVVGSGGATRCVQARSRPSPYVLVLEVAIVDGGSGGHSISHVSSRPSLFSQPSLVGK